MTNIPNSDVYKFIEYVRAMPLPVYHLARAVIHGTVGLYEVSRAAEVIREYPTDEDEYDFIGVLAGGNPEELAAGLEAATEELVSDFYAWLDGEL